MKRNILPAAVIAAVTLLLPWLSVTFVPGDGGLAVTFIQFYALNPLLALGMGVLAGKRRQWWWTMIPPGMFLLGAWLVFAPGETGFLRYAGAYLALGLAAMAVTRLALRIKER